MITLVDGEKIIQDDAQVASTLNDFFSEAVASLGVEIPVQCLTEGPVICNDPIDDIILKYSNHPSIKLINENVKTDKFAFTTIKVEDMNKIIENMLCLWII